MVATAIAGYLSALARNVIGELSMFESLESRRMFAATPAALAEAAPTPELAPAMSLNFPKITYSLNFTKIKFDTKVAMQDFHFTQKVSQQDFHFVKTVDKP